MNQGWASMFHKVLGPVKLYLDDIGQIAQTLQHLLSEAELSFFIPGRELATIEELSGLDRPEQDALEIRCSVAARPSCVLLISVHRDGVFLCRTADNPACKRAFSETEELLLARQRSGRWCRRLPGWAGAVGCISAFAAALGAVGAVPGLLYAGVALAGLSLALLALYAGTRRFSLSRVILVEKHQHRAYADVAIAVGTIVLVTLIIASVVRVLADITL